MNKKTIIIALVVLAVAVGGYCLYDFVLGEPDAASGPTNAVPLGTPVPTPIVTPAASPTAAPQATPTPSPAPTAPAAVTPEVTPAATPAETAAPAATATPAPATAALAPATPAAPAAPRKFVIDQTVSKAQFEIFEVLRGKDKNVVGVTNQVAGEMELHPDDLAATRLGTILINARTLQTDDQNRNRAMQNRIMHTNQYEFVKFEPVKLTGLAGPANIGDSLPFKIEGNLTIQNITKPAVFDAKFKQTDANTIIGSATTTVKKTEYGLFVPNLPFLANVGEDVKLTIEATLKPAP